MPLSTLALFPIFRYHYTTLTLVFGSALYLTNFNDLTFASPLLFNTFTAALTIALAPELTLAPALALVLAPAVALLLVLAAFALVFALTLALALALAFALALPFIPLQFTRIYPDFLKYLDNIFFLYQNSFNLYP